MKQIVCILMMFFLSANSFAQRSFQLYSPDSSLNLIVTVSDKLSYILYAGSVQLVSSSSVDVEVDNAVSLSGKTELIGKKYSRSNETIDVPIPYRRKKINNEYSQLELRFNKPFSIQFRLCNNGMAYRLGLHFKDSVYIKSESAGFDFDINADCWFAHIDKRPDVDRYHTSFEGVYKKERLSAIPDSMLTFSPVTAVLPNGFLLSISDANLIDYPGMFLQPSAAGLKGLFASMPLEEKMSAGDYPQWTVSKRTDYLVKTNGKRMLPWRAILVAKKDIELVANDMLYTLGDESKIKDPSWIRYGKSTDEWITNTNLFNIPFLAGINTQTYKYYIDFAKRFGFDQVMLDAGWSDVKDLSRITPGMNMNELTAYAKEKGVRLMLWTLSATLDRQLDSALTQFNKWGIESIMTDFMDRDDAKTVGFYHRVAKACADHKIAVMFHGAFPPKGLNRTWPNVITHEGVLGSEWNIWSDLPTPQHDVAIAYTRMLAGPLDYEPGLLLNAQKDQFKSIGGNPMSQGTRCHQLAMFVTYDSPLQIFSGNISQGILETAYMNLLGSIPTVWDDTKIIDGAIGEYIVTARRNGNNWFISGLNGNESRKIKFDTRFLEKGTYKLILCKDGVNANKYGSDYHIEERTIESGGDMEIQMANGGGFLIKLSKL